MSLTAWIDAYKAALPRGITVAPQLGAEQPGQPEREVARQPLVIDNEATGRTYVTVPASHAPARETAAAAWGEAFLTRLSGRLVQAETANDNGAFWSTSDLEHGLHTVALGPLNWLHQDRKIVGVLSEARLVGREAAAALPAVGGRALGPHIHTDAVMWKYLFPEEAAVLDAAAAAGRTFLSMECVSKEVACVGPNGCGKVMPYLDHQRRTGAACEHVRERASHRRFIDPVFQGAAVIVPPTLPGWKDAHLDVVRQADRLLSAVPEAAALAGTGEDAEALVAQILAFVGTGA